ncbi:MAG: CDP-alcohol phosphatidyltransferase family protein [Spirochaetota bacterium]
MTSGVAAAADIRSLRAGLLSTIAITLLAVLTALGFAFGWGIRTVHAVLVVVVPSAYLTVVVWTRAFENRPSWSDPLRARVGPANSITLSRAVAIAFVPAIELLDSGSRTGRWVAFALYAAFLLADLADGFVARSRDERSLLGRTLENEADSLGVLAVSIYLVIAEIVPWYILLAGVARYLFVIAVWVRRAVGATVYPLQHSSSGRILAGIMMNSMLLCTVPAFPTWAARTLMPVAAIPFLLGFVRDYFGVSTGRWLLSGRVRGGESVADCSSSRPRTPR